MSHHWCDLNEPQHHIRKEFHSWDRKLENKFFKFLEVPSQTQAREKKKRAPPPPPSSLSLYPLREYEPNHDRVEVCNRRTRVW